MSNDKIAPKVVRDLWHIIVLIVVGVVVLVYIGGQIFLKFGNYGAMMFPKSVITELPNNGNLYRPNGEFPVKMVCPTLPYTIDMPEGVLNQEDVLIAGIGDVTIAVRETLEDAETLMGNTMPRLLYTPLLGYEPKVSVWTKEKGYVYQNLAEFATSTVKTQVSVRSVTTYNMMYLVDLGADEKLCVYASVEDTAELEKAHEYLMHIVSSITFKNGEDTHVGAENEEVLTSEEYEEKYGDFAMEQLPRPEYYEINYPFEVEKDVEDYYVIVTWDNIFDEPTELVMYDADGDVCEFLDESYAGWYVYRTDSSKKGEFRIVGTTKTQLIGWYVEQYDGESYNMFFVEESTYSHIDDVRPSDD